MDIGEGFGPETLFFRIVGKNALKHFTYITNRIMLLRPTSFPVLGIIIEDNVEGGVLWMVCCCLI